MEPRTPAGALLTLDEVRGRLAALRAEMDRLERDRTVFARAFHLQVAHAVHAELVRDEARLAAMPALDLTVGPGVPCAVAVPDAGGQVWSAPGRGRREVLEL